MTAEELRNKLNAIITELGNAEIAVESRDPEVYGDYDQNLRLEYHDDRSALVPNTLVL